MEWAVSLSGHSCNDQCGRHSLAVLPGYLGVGPRRRIYGVMELWFSEAYSLGHGCGTPELLTQVSNCGPRAEWTLPGDLGLNEAETSSRDN